VRVFVNRVVKRIFGLKTEGGSNRSIEKKRNEELYNFYSSPDIIRLVISRRMRWESHVAHMGR
jgi:hypothetical protein